MWAGVLPEVRKDVIEAVHRGRACRTPAEAGLAISYARRLRSGAFPPAVWAGLALVFWYEPFLIGLVVLTVVQGVVTWDYVGRAIARNQEVIAEHERARRPKQLPTEEP